jgi:hypothetical protein
MSFASLVADIVARLDRAGIPYMLTGSLVSAYYGEPRATRDVDVVVDPDAASLERLLRDLKAGDFYVDPDVAHEALAQRGQFNAVSPTATKVDFIVRKDHPFSAAEFGRRMRADLLGVPVMVASPEDLVIAKLRWAAETDSERQLRDVSAVLRTLGSTLDRAYLTRWITSLGLGHLLARAESEP